MAFGTRSFADGDGYLEWLNPQTPPRAGQTQVAPIQPPAAPPAVPSAIGLEQGFTPNYLGLIKQDPSYLSYVNNATLDVNQAAARRRAALQALAVRYGGLGGGFKDAYGDIDSATLDLARGNQLSDTARLSRNYSQGVEAMKRALAARRGLQSGELTYGLQQADFARAASEYDLGQEFGRAAQLFINDYLEREAAVRRGEAGAISEAEQNVYANPVNRPTEGTEARLVSDWQTRYGQPVWQGPDGKLYVLDGNGNPVPYAPASADSAGWVDLLARTVSSGQQYVAA